MLCCGHLYNFSVLISRPLPEDGDLDGLTDNTGKFIEVHLLLVKEETVQVESCTAVLLPLTKAENIYNFFYI